MLDSPDGVCAPMGSGRVKRQARAAPWPYQAALQLAEALPSRIEQADLRRLSARMLLDRDQPGDREGAQTLLSKATDAYLAIGMPEYAAPTSTLIARAQ